MTPFECFEMFLALRNHFTRKSYDYIKYNGKMKVSYESYIKRHDKLFYAKLARKDDPFYFVISNMIVDPDIWIGELFKDKAQKNFDAWKIRNSALVYNFTNDIRALAKTEISLRELMAVKNGQHPKLLEYYLESKISPETLLIINDLTGVLSVWDKKIDDTVLWPEINLKLRKYKSFIKYPKPISEFGKIIIDILGKE